MGTYDSFFFMTCMRSVSYCYPCVVVFCEFPYVCSLGFHRMFPSVMHKGCSLWGCIEFVSLGMHKGVPCGCSLVGYIRVSLCALLVGCMRCSL